jgi:hypothetical protein
VTRVDGDPVLLRIERTAIAACLVMTVAAFMLTRRPGPAVAVLAGGLLIAISYRTIGSGVSALVALLARESDRGTAARSAPHLAITLAKVAGRYALLALLAYVMIARLRLHPIGLLAGASSVVAAAAVEAIRLLTKKQP